LPDFTAAGTGSLDLDETLDLYAQGAVSFNALSGIAVGTGSFTLTLGQVSGTDGVTTLNDAQALSVTLTDVELWVGPGGTLDDGGTVIDVTDVTTFTDDTVGSGDLGFRGHVGSLKLASLKDLKGTLLNPADDVSYLALDIGALNATLVGLDALLVLNAWNVAVLVNQVAVTAPAVAPSKLDWAGFTVTSGISLPVFNTELTDAINLGLSGSVTLNALSGVLVARSDFSMSLGAVTELGADGSAGGTGANADTEYQAMYLTLGTSAFVGAAKVEVFVGLGGELDDGGTAVDVTDVTTFTDDTVEFASGLGFYASLDSLSLVMLKNNNATSLIATDDKSYMALEINGLSAKLVGVDGLTFGVWDGVVKINQATDSDANPLTNPAKLDWPTFFGNTTGSMPAGIPNVNAGVGIEAQGSAALDAFGVLVAKGSFKLQLGTVTKAGTDYQAMALTLGNSAFTGATKVEVFVGIGGELKDNVGDDALASGSFSDDTVDITAGLGFYASLDSLSLVMLKNNNATPLIATDDKSYMALEISGMTAKLVGIEGLTFGVWDGAVKVNTATDTDNNVATVPAKLDWTTFFTGTTGLVPAGIPNVNAGVGIEAQGSVALDAFGVLVAKGSFKLQLGTVTELGANGVAGGSGINADTEYQAMVLTLGSNAFAGATKVEVFVGIGGVLDDVSGDDALASGSFSDDTVDITAGLGFYASLDSLSLVTLKNNNRT
ncbi:MAG: hypothetical protein Q7T59_06150, partial [Candidatus Woesebacteria bacterium]|nr:hypothetical protein [Candidatus Woesebacteria bacterium]